MMSHRRKALTWAALILVIGIPLLAAAMSPQLEWRGPAYIAAGFSGVAAMALLLIQPLLIGGYLPGFSPHSRRLAHKLAGSILVLAVLAHVIGLWITSPPDMIDALLFRSPTLFSAWGVIAMWAIFGAALLAHLKRKLRIRPLFWRFAHTSLAVITVVGSVVHAMMIEGTMETISKAILCFFVIATTAKLLVDKRRRISSARKRSNISFDQ